MFELREKKLKRSNWLMLDIVEMDFSELDLKLYSFHISLFGYFLGHLNVFFH